MEGEKRNHGLKLDEMMPKVSVIVPVYGVEKYIERCVRSLMGQTLKDMQFIFVDDCTPDNSINLLKDIIKDYPNRENQVVILYHDNNKGLPAARQTGIQAASGDYIAHCDSDDWVEANLYETMYNAAITQHADISVCNCFDSNGKVNIKERVGGYKDVITDCIDDMLHGKMWWSLCNKLIKKEIYGCAIEYPKDGMGEDMCTVLQLMLYCKNIVYCPTVHYFYYINEESIMHYLTEEKCLSNFHQINRNVEIVINVYERNNVYDYFKNGLCFIAFKSKGHLHPLLGNKVYYKLWKSSYKGVDFNVVLNKKVSIKERLLALLSMIGLFPIPRGKYSYMLKK